MASYKTPKRSLNLFKKGKNLSILLQAAKHNTVLPYFLIFLEFLPTQPKLRSDLYRKRDAIEQHPSRTQIFDRIVSAKTR